MTLLSCPNCWHDRIQIIRGNVPSDGAYVECKAWCTYPRSSKPTYICRFKGAWCPTRAEAIDEWNHIANGIRTIEVLQTLQADFKTLKPTINQLLSSKGFSTSTASGNYRKHIHNSANHIVFTGDADDVVKWLDNLTPSVESVMTIMGDL